MSSVAGSAAPAPAKRVDRRCKVNGGAGRVRTDRRAKVNGGPGRKQVDGRSKIRGGAGRERMPWFIALDGEGRDSGPSKMVGDVSVRPQEMYLICASDATAKYQSVLLWEEKGSIPTHKIFEFVLSLPHSATLIGYGLGWDYSMWLRDVPKDLRRSLLNRESRRFGPKFHQVRKVWWKGPNNVLYGMDLVANRFTLCRKGDSRCHTVWDVIRFFQDSFVGALKAWVPGIDPSDLEHIQKMKSSRDHLGSDADAEIRYSLSENMYCSQMMTRLKTALLDAGLDVRSYYGAGSIWSAIAKKHGVKDFMPEPETEPLPPLVQDAAYFGGRFEISAHGPIERPVWEYDISSAYPAAMTKLPCLRHGKFVPTKSLRLLEKAEWYVAQLRWDIPDTVWGPLPVRNSHGVFWPQKGVGYFYSPECRQALEHFGEYIKVLNGFYWKPECDHGPLTFMNELFDDRLRLDASGNQKGKVLKVGMNAGYGKTVQRVGHPHLQCIIWGGMITSHCRAEIMRAVSQAPEQVIAIATDAVYSLSPLHIESDRKLLGTWEMKKHPDGFFLVRSGIIVPYDDGKPKSRGLEAKAFGNMQAELTEVWRLMGIGGSVDVNVTRFIGLRSGLVRPDMWNKWITYPITVNFTEAPKRRDTYERDGILRSWPVREVSDARKLIQLGWKEDDDGWSFDEKTLLSEQPDYVAANG